MKILTAIILSTGLLMISTSCTKEYTCECVYTNQEDSADTYSSESTLQNTKKDAEDNCEHLSGTSYSGSKTYDVDCSIL